MDKKMDAQTYRLLEAKLAEAEEEFWARVKFGAQAFEIQADLVRLIGKVSVRTNPRRNIGREWRNALLRSLRKGRESL